MHEPPCDRQLDRTLAQAADGDAQAWVALVEQYTPRVYALLLRQCGDRDLAEELTQDTFVSVVKNLGRYSEQGKFEPWLFRIAMNRLRDEMRRRKRQARSMDMSPASMADNTEAGAPHRSRDDEPLAQLARAEQVELVRLAVEQLSDADRQIIHLRHAAGLTFAQIAESLNQPLGTVLARGHRALAKLRAALTAQETDATT